MSETSTACPAKCSPQSGFGAIAGITISVTEKFLQTIQHSLAAANSNVTDGLLLDFLFAADSFSGQCSEKFAVMLRQSSSQPEVRETTEPVLQRLVRNRCFESLDLILADYLSLLDQTGVDLKSRLSQLGDSRLRETVKRLSSPAVSGRKDAPKILTPEVKARALMRIRDYLISLDHLPHDLVDYGAIKLFGGDVDFVLQKTYLQNIRDGIHEKLRGCLAAVEGFESLKQKLWEDRRAAETAAITAAALNSVQSTVKKKGGIGFLGIGLVCTAPIWIISTFGTKGPYLIGGAVASGIIAIAFVYVGICRLTKA